MQVDRTATMRTVVAQLADDLACHPADLARREIVPVALEERQGRRTFPFDRQTLQVVTIGRGVVVSCPPEQLPDVKAALAGADDEDVFDMPYLARLAALASQNGRTLHGPFQHAVCWPAALQTTSPPQGVSVELLAGADIAQLYAYQGFENALEYRPGASRPDVLAAAALVDGLPVAVAGASADSERLWQIGVDVQEAWRGKRLAAALVGRVTEAVLAAGRVPYYSTSISHLTSARVALSLGYVPAWVACYTRPAA